MTLAPDSKLPEGWAVPSLDEDGSAAYRFARRLRRPVVERFLQSLSDPQRAQAEALERVLVASANTDFARRHGLARVRSLADYRAAVPIRGWEAFAADLRRVAWGDTRALLAAPVRRFVKTSGTTGEAKLLPVTDVWAQEVADAQALWVLGMVKEQPELAGGQALSIVGPADEGRTPSGLRFGSNTGRMNQAQPWWVRARYAVPPEVFEGTNAELRRYLLLRLALGRDVRSITTANPSSLLALARAFDHHRADLEADLRDGTLRRGPAAALGCAERARLWPWAWRARLAPGVRLGEHWQLAAINCWKGGAAPFFVDLLPNALGAAPPVREAGISASEGYFAIPLHSSWSGGVAWAAGHLLELIDAQGVPHGLTELTVGERYRLVISTTAGLYRYDLDDYLEVVGWYGRAPVLRFVGKGAEITSATGEKVSAAQAAEAARLAVAPGAVGVCVGVRLAERPIYLLCVETCSEGAGADAQVFDHALRRLNNEYDGKRASDRLASPEVVLLPEGTFARYRGERLGAGAAEGQVKDPILLPADALARLIGGWR